MKKILPKLVMVFMTVTIIIGCSVTHSVNTKSTQELAKDLKGISGSVENVKFTFTRPNLLITVDVTENPGNDAVESILSKVKTFATVDSMNEIARSVKWKLEISEIRLVINGGKGDQAGRRVYFARYFKTYDASDNSEENIDGYKTWFEEAEESSFK
ncbi:hypothetical protein [Paenibacillus hamazuiensis]|uniref:hypothetical protein n=1 Tax=Paenibacillus hamazuiensis TaxID=2936508 RepID=UPI002010C3C9|nr:hypothetical protein [Paenibacillus hamazuiensis]